MNIFRFPGEYIAELTELPPENVSFLAIIYTVNVPFYIFLVRTILIYLFRKFGLFHPSQYRYWPRVPWRTLMIVWVKFRIWFERTFQMGKRATGGFANALETLTLMYKPGQIFLGRAFAWGFGLLQPVGMKVERHLFMYAMTKAGKTTALITILSTWHNSVFCIDPKAQITNALSHHDWRNG